MYVESLELINVRSFKKAVVNFSPKINLLVGHNNSGKSTLLKSIYSLQDYNPLLTQPQDIRVDQGFARIFLKLTDISATEKKLFKNHKKNQGREPHSTEQSIILSISKFENKAEYKVEQFCYAENADSANKIERFRGPVQRDGITVSDSEIFPRFSYKEDENSFIYPFFSKRKQTHYSGRGNKEAFHIYDDFRNLPSRVELLSNASHPRNEEFINHCKDILGFIIGSLPGNDSEQRLGAFVTPKTYVYLESMGEGVANIVGLIAMLLTEDRMLYLIEEPENDIHPLALKKLLQLIVQKSVSNQFVISTHSNIVLKYLAAPPTTKIFKTSWSSSEVIGGRIINIPTSTVEEVENDPESRLSLLTFLGYDFFDFELYQSYLLFEESSAEKFVRDILIPMFVPQLINKVKTISANGTSDLEARFVDFHRLFVYDSHQRNPQAFALPDATCPGKPAFGGRLAVVNS